MANDIGMTIRKGSVVSFLPCLVAFWGFHPYMFFHFFKCSFCYLYSLPCNLLLLGSLSHSLISNGIGIIEASMPIIDHEYLRTLVLHNCPQVDSFVPSPHSQTVQLGNEASNMPFHSEPLNRGEVGKLYIAMKLLMEHSQFNKN